MRTHETMGEKPDRNRALTQNLSPCSLLTPLAAVQPHPSCRPPPLSYVFLESETCKQKAKDHPELPTPISAHSLLSLQLFLPQYLPSNGSKILPLVQPNLSPTSPLVRPEILMHTFTAL